MARLPPLKKLNLRDLRLDVFGRLYNQFINDIIYMMNRRLTFNENFDCQVDTITLDGNFPVRINWTRPMPPTGVFSTKLARVDKTPTALSAGYVIEWEYEDGVLSIINTPGLTSSASDQYNLTLISIVG